MDTIVAGTEIGPLVRDDLAAREAQFAATVCADGIDRQKQEAVTQYQFISSFIEPSARLLPESEIERIVRCGTVSA